MTAREGIMEDRVLSRAIILYLAKGRSPFPKSDDAAVIAAAHPVDAPALLDRVRRITDECMAIDIDWASHSLVEGGEEARQTMAIRHPELSPEALDALRWMFTYNWR